MNDSVNTVNAGICACYTDELIDLREIKVDKKAPLSRRKEDFIAQIGNPCFFKVDDVAVKIEFSGEKSFTEILAGAILAG